MRSAQPNPSDLFRPVLAPLFVTAWLTLAGCAADPEELPSSSPPADDASFDFRPLVDADIGAADAPREPIRTVDSGGNGDLDVGADWDCSSGPHCVAPRTREYCINGVPEQVPCPDGYGCVPTSGDCRPVVCEPSESACIDDATLRQCVDNGTRIEDLACGPSGCEVDACSNVCVEGRTRCIDDRAYEVCRDGAFAEASCPEDALGTVCFDDRCVSACERAALESDYAGCVFWAVDLDNIVDPFGAGPGAEGIAVVVSNVSPHPAQIDIRADPETAVASGVLAPGALETFELFPRDVIGTRIELAAYRITSTVPVLAYQFNPLNREGTSSTDASLLLPQSALGERYRVMSYPAQGTNQRGFVSVVGVGEATTRVSMTVRGRTIAGVDHRDPALPLENHVLPGLSPGQTLTRALDPFEVWQVESSSDADLTGTLIRSDGPVAVFSGTRCSNVPRGVPSCDHLEHQMIPVATWGRNYVAAVGPRRDRESTTFRVLADFERTYLETTPPVSGTPTTLGPGDVLTFEVLDATAIRATEPVMVGQYLASADAGAGGLGDPSFTIVPPVEQFRDAYIFLVPDSYEMDAVTLMRARVSGAEPPDIILDGVDLEAAFAELFLPVGDSGYEVAQIIVDDGVHELSSTSPFGVLVAGYDQDVSYAYPGGLQLYKPEGASFDDAAGRCSDGGWVGAACDTGSAGRCARGRTLCGPDSICVPELSAASERCNGVDDDCDGAVDEAGVCSDELDFFFVSPGPRLVELVEGDTQEFRVAVDYSGTDPLEIAWFIDSPEEPVTRGDRLVWRVLAFEAGVHRVEVVATAGGERAQYEWLVHIHDVPTNFPTLYGQAFDLDRRIVENAPVTVAASGVPFGPIPGGPSFTDFRGYYALSLAPGTYDLMIQADAPVPVGFPSGWRVLEPGLLGVTDSRRDVQVPVARMWGFVYGPDADGTPVPVANAGVQTSPASPTVCSRCRQSAGTGADGGYELFLFTGRHHVSVQGFSESGARFPMRSLEIDIAADMRRDFYFDSLPPAGETVEFWATVTEPCTDGTVSGARIRVSGGGYFLYLYSDAEGRITANVPPGEYEAFSSPSPGAVPPIGPGQVSLGSLTVPADNGAVLEIPNGYVSGRVHAEGEVAGLADIALEFRGECPQCRATTVTSAEATEEGTYALYLLDSSYEVELTPPTDSGWPNFTTPSNAIASCSETLDIVLRPPVHRIDGTVTAIRTDLSGELVSVPVDNLSLELRGPTRTDFDTDEEGSFGLLAVPGGYEIYLRGLRHPSSLGGILPAGRLVIWYSGDELASADPAAPIRLELSPLELPLTMVSGTVTNIEGGGLGLEGAELRWIHQPGDCSGCERTVTTDASGAYDVILYRPIWGDDDAFTGVYRVEIDPGEFFPPQVIDELVIEGRSLRLDITVEE